MSWEQMWAELTSYFGLVGAGPDEKFNIEEYIQAHKSEFLEWIDKNGLKKQAVENTNFGHLTFMMTLAAFDRQYDLSKARGIGFTETQKSAEGYLATFGLMKKANIIP